MVLSMLQGETIDGGVTLPTHLVICSSAAPPRR